MLINILEKSVNEIIQFSDLKIGLRVKDQEGYIGKIVKIKNINCIVVEYETGTGGYGFYCLDPSCKTLYDPLFKA